MLRSNLEDHQINRIEIAYQHRASRARHGWVLSRLSRKLRSDSPDAAASQIRSAPIGHELLLLSRPDVIIPPKNKVTSDLGNRPPQHGGASRGGGNDGYSALGSA